MIVDAFVYGLPELNKDLLRSATLVANPGCFATAIQLGLLPLAKAGVLKEIYTTGITGSTGAGQSLSATSHFSWRANNIQAYKTLTHQHLGEIGECIQQLQTKSPDERSISFPGEEILPAASLLARRRSNKPGAISIDRFIQEVL